LKRKPGDNDRSAASLRFRRIEPLQAWLEEDGEKE